MQLRLRNDSDMLELSKTLSGLWHARILLDLVRESTLPTEIEQFATFSTCRH